MVVFAFISDNKHGRILQKPLHMLPSRATPHAAALVIAPGMWRALDRLLAILAPRVVIRWDLSLLAAYGWDLNSLLHPQLPTKF
jgi:hypothetical protein